MVISLALAWLWLMFLFLGPKFVPFLTLNVKYLCRLADYFCNDKQNLIYLNNFRFREILKFVRKTKDDRDSSGDVINNEYEKLGRIRYASSKT